MEGWTSVGWHWRGASLASVFDPDLSKRCCLVGESHGPAPSIHSARHGDVEDVAQLADRVIAVEILRLVLARLGTAGDQIGAGIDVGRGGVDGEERERSFGTPLGENAHAAGDALVEADCRGTRRHRLRLEGRLLLRQVRGVFRTDDSELLTERRRVGRMHLDPVGQRPRAGDSGGEFGRFVRVLGERRRLGRLRGIELRVEIGVRGRQRVGVRRDQPERRGGNDDLRLKVVMPRDQIAVRLGNVVLLGHEMSFLKGRCERRPGQPNGRPTTRSGLSR